MRHSGNEREKDGEWSAPQGTRHPVSHDGLEVSAMLGSSCWLMNPNLPTFLKNQDPKLSMITYLCLFGQGTIITFCLLKCKFSTLFIMDVSRLVSRPQDLILF